MSEIKLTESQQLFVDSIDKNTLVSASAGSGKTSTMIAKLTKMIVEDKIPIRNLLVVTYTNSAGSEMKQKLFNSLVKAMQNIDSEETLAFVSEQLDEMVNCDIGTLHSICKKIITNYFYVVEQDPSFTLLNEQQSAYLYDNSMNKVFNELIAQDDEDFYYLYSLYNKKRNLNNLKYVVKTLHNYLLSKVDADEWEKRVIDEARNSEASKRYLIEYYKGMFCSFKNKLLILKEKCANYFDTYLNYVSDRLNFVLAIEGIAEYDKLYNFVSAYEFIKKPRVISTKLSPDVIDIVEETDLIMKDFSELVKNFKANFILMLQGDCDDYVKHVQLLFNVVKQVKVDYSKVKKNQNVLDFSDLEHITLEILNNESVVSALRDKYQFIFIDEYQDINQVQEIIISKIKREDNLFMIGDVKQSIYAFRLSSPEIFINKYDKFLIETDKNRVINLNENFRSQENILEFSNMIFNKLITKDTVGIDYEKNSQLVAGLKDDFKKCVSLDIIDEECDITEAQLIACKVGELVKDGFNFSDIAILVRSKGELVNEITDEFKKYNIPCEATYKTDLFSNNEVVVLYYLLKLLNNSYDDVAMATVLKSLFVKLSEDELAEIRLINEEMSFNECVYEYMLSGTNEHIKQKLYYMDNLIKDIKHKLNNVSIVDMFNWLFVEYDILNYYLSFVDGLEKVSNIKEFLRIVSNDEYKYDIQKCVDYLDSVKKDGEVTLTLSGVGDSVKIMTMHSSKGLEYPAVIIGGVGKKFVLNKQTEDIIINDKLGVGVKQFNLKTHTQKESIIKNACKICNKKNEINEEIRLLYVALTRAKKRLCIVGKYSTENIALVANKGIYSSRSYLDLIFKALPHNSLKFFENKVENFIVGEGYSYEFDVHCIKDGEIEDSIIKRNIILNEKDESVIKKLNKYYDYRYAYDNGKNIAVKNSVSQVLKEEVDYENQVDSVALNTTLDDYSLRLGTAYHTIMQNIKCSENKAEIIQLINNLKTSDLPYNDIQVDKIENAINNVKKYLNSDSKVLKEAQFVMKVNYGQLTNSCENVDVLIQGVIDLVIINGDDAIIIDFKTNKTHSKQYLVEHYGLQLKMYAEAFEKAYNIKVNKKLLYSFEMDMFIEV